MKGIPTEMVNVSSIGSNSSSITDYVADYYNHAIRKIVISSGVVSTLAGSSTGTPDGTGTGARFFKPR